jgi:hypothetical protein
MCASVSGVPKSLDGSGANVPKHMMEDLMAVNAFRSVAWIVAVVLTVSWTPLSAADLRASLKEGKLELQSAGPLAFGPDGILFAADPQAAAICAIATGDGAAESQVARDVEALDEKIAALLGTSPQQILIHDLAVNPASRVPYLSVSRGRGPDASAVIVRIAGAGKPEVLSLEKVKFSRVEIPNAPQAGSAPGGGRRGDDPRRESITDLAFVDGQLLVAGLSNEEFASTLRSIPFPFEKADKGTSVEIYHGAHGKFETRSPVRTFVPFSVGGEPHLLAAYTCTPLVAFPLSSLKPGAHVKGKTVAELGNRNRPLDMISYQKGGKAYLLLANSSRGVMKVSTESIEKSESITEHVSGGGTRGLPYETIADWKGVDQLDRLDDGRAVVVRRAEGGPLSLQTLPLP